MLGELRWLPLVFAPHPLQTPGKFGYDLLLVRQRFEHAARINLGMTAKGVAERLQDILAGFETDIASRQRTIVDETRRLQAFESRLGQPFSFSGELDLKREQTDLAATTATAEAA